MSLHPNIAQLELIAPDVLTEIVQGVTSAGCRGSRALHAPVIASGDAVRFATKSPPRIKVTMTDVAVIGAHP